MQLALCVRLMMAQAGTETMSMMLQPFLANARRVMLSSRSSCCSVIVREGERIVTDWLLSISSRLGTESLCSAKS